MEKTPAAGVTVEYSDPTGIYQHVARELHSRLPLKGLHWTNFSGVSRSIDNLYIELVPNDRSKPNLDSTSFDGSSNTQDSVPVGKGEGSKKGRRHQFPGLRRTPYLKIYLLQCGDVDTYRATSRTLLREWVKAQTSSGQSKSQLNKQENHDAFEWLILHVLPASIEGSRRTSSTRVDGNVEKRPSTSRWPSRSSSSVIEKIRSDFNGTSKNAVDRVAQVQLVEPAIESSAESKRQPQDDQNGWDDLSTKLKSLILASFDLRVSQYEEDIKEKEMQRNLPGWNFNTFFVLKEGLAIGFENIGLLEDALTVYRELAVGLGAVIDDQGDSGDENKQTTLFSLYTDELKAAFEQAVNAHRNDGTCAISAPNQNNKELFPVLDLGASILDTDRKPFRILILESNISVFDFQCYVFARQMILLLRLANALGQNSASTIDENVNEGERVLPTSSNSTTTANYGSINLHILAEATELSTEFISSVTQTARADLRTAIQHSDTSEETDREIVDALHDNLTGSWTFSASLRILEATSASSLSKQLDTLLQQLRPIEEPGNNASERQVTEVADRDNLPARTSSLLSNSTKPKSLPRKTFSSITALDSVRLLIPGKTHPGAAELAAQRGDLLALLRRVLSGLGLRHGGWRGGLADTVSFSEVQDDELEQVKLDDHSTQGREGSKELTVKPRAPTTAGIYNSKLLSALRSSKDFYTTYEEVTTSALGCYVVGDRKQAAEAMMADLAAIYFQLEDYDVAASYFRQLAPFYAKSHWSNLEIAMLNMYAQCLRYLQRADDYVRTALRTLANTIQSRPTTIAQHRRGSAKRLEASSTVSCTTISLEDILDASASLDQPIFVPMDQYFDKIRLDRYICHSAERDGFTLPLRLRSLLSGNLEAQIVRARLISVGGEQRSELCLATDNLQIIKPGMAELMLKSNMMLPGWYVLDNISIQSSNVIFINDVDPTSNAPFLKGPSDSMSSKQSDFLDQKRILVWPSSKSLEARVMHSEYVNLEQPKSIKVEIASGRNKVSNGKLLVRAASAGLRLHTAEATVQRGGFRITDRTHPGTISFDELSADTTASVRIPYSLESDLSEIGVRIEVIYTTPEGDFVYACNSKIQILLPLAINVQDIFKKNVLFSRFTVGTATAAPLRLFHCHLESNSDFYAESPSSIQAELDVFDLQPYSFISRIRRRSRREIGTNPSGPTQQRLYLQIEYRCLHAVICAVVDNLFSEALEGTSFRTFSRALKPTLLIALQQRFSTQSLEKTGLHREITLGDFSEFGWNVPLAGLHPDHGELLAKWLESWHEKHQTISLEGIFNLSPMQHLTVPVDVPGFQILHTVQLRSLDPTDPNSEQASIPIGQGLPMKLTISHTRYWDIAPRRGKGDRALGFCYELQANSDWLIGGQRRGQFTAREDEVSTFSLLLWPQTTGHLLLPSIEIYAVGPSQDRASNDGSRAEAGTACEIDYKDQSQTILVVPNLLMTTVNLDLSGSGGWLVGSQSRSS